MTDTTIGYAVLQIIPSLKGVSDAIDKEIGGHVVAVTIEPKWPEKGSAGAKKLDKSISDAVTKTPVEVEIEPKVEPAKIDKAVKDSVKKSKPPEIKIEPKLDEAKTTRAGDTLKDIITGAIEDAGWSVDELADKAAKTVGGKIGEVIGNSRVGHWIQDVSEKVQDVRDRVSAATEGFGHMSDAIGSLKSGDAAGGLNGISNALTAIGQSDAGSTIGDIATQVAPLQQQFYALKDGISGVGSMIETLASGSERYGGRFAALGAAVSEFAGPLAMAAAAAAGVAWGLNEIAKAPDPTKGFQSPIRGHEGAPVIPVPGSAPLVVTPPAPPGTHYVQTPGSLDPFAALLPAGAGPAPTSAPVLPSTGNVPDMTRFLHPDMPDHAGGGLISGPGSGTSDSILGWPAMVRVSNKEFITNAAATDKNLPLLQAVNSGAPLWDWLRSMPGFAPGGMVGDRPKLNTAGAQVDTIAIAEAVQARFGLSDIGMYRSPDGFNEHSSGEAADVMIPGSNKTLGDSIKDFALANAAAYGVQYCLWQQRQWNPDGTSSPMSDRGSPTQNHMDHVHIRTAGGGYPTGGGPGSAGSGSMPAGTSSTPAPAVLAGNRSGIGASPSGDLPIIDIAGGGGGPRGTSGGGVPLASALPAVGGIPSSGGGSINLPSSLSGFGSFAGQQLGQLGGLAQMGSALGDLGQLGSAAGSVIDGQVSSALNLFGVPGSPGWLKGISTLIGGIRIGGGGGSAMPLAASPTAMGPMAPGDAANMHGGHAGQQPGPPGVTYNITARDTEDAFIRAQRLEREKAAAKLDRF